MKNNFKTLILLFLSIVLVSCSDDETPTTFDENINSERFTGLELGNSDFVLPQSNIDVHTEFDYQGTSKVTKIYFNVQPHNISTPQTGETAWELKDHLVPVDSYQGQLNPHIHYHVYFDEENRYQTAFRPAEGVYKFKITVEHEDGSRSAITKELHIIKKFKNMEIGENNIVAIGTDELHTEYQYISGNDTVTEIKYQLWFKEWREGQNVEVGKWDKVETILPANLYENVRNPEIHYHYDLLEGSPAGGYWLNIYVKENGESEAVKLSVPFRIQ